MDVKKEGVVFRPLPVAPQVPKPLRTPPRKSDWTVSVRPAATDASTAATAALARKG